MAEPYTAALARPIWRHFRSNSLRSLLVYFFVSNWFQAPTVRRYVEAARSGHARRYGEIVWQWTTVAMAHALMLGIAVGAYGPSRGAYLYGVAFVAQVAFAWWSMFFVNFVQHFDCDPSSRCDHSRNFVGKLDNLLTSTLVRRRVSAGHDCFRG